MLNNKKGFTLIELLAVIVILGIILTIATTSVIKSINDSKEKAKYVAAREIVDIASAYIATKGSGVEEDSTGKTCISIDFLIENGYLEEDATNPKTGENGGDFTNQKVCLSSDSKEQTNYEAKNGIYEFDGYQYVTTITEAEEVQCVRGDLNCDGKVDQEDVDLLYKYAAVSSSNPDYNEDGKVDEKDEEIKKKADLNGDGGISASDAIVIYSIIAEQEENRFSVAKEITEIASKYITQNINSEESKIIKLSGDNNEIPCVEVSTLIEDGYLKNNIINPKTGEKGGSFKDQLVCEVSNKKEQSDYKPTNGTYSFDGYQYFYAEYKTEDGFTCDRGDLNCDGKVDQKDADIIYSYAACTTGDYNRNGVKYDKYDLEILKVANLNGDSVISASDAIVIYSIIAENNGN